MVEDDTANKTASDDFVSIKRGIKAENTTDIKSAGSKKRENTNLLALLDSTTPTMKKHRKKDRETTINLLMKKKNLSIFSFH